MMRNYICILLFNLLLNVMADVLLYFYNESKVLVDFKDMPSAFGGELPYEGLTAKVKYAEPADGCKLIEPPLPVLNSTQKWVALISRNNCTFELKIRNAQSANYSGVIVHNVGSDYTEEITVENDTGIVIPSVFIGEHDGLYLKTIFALDDLYFIIIMPDSHLIGVCIDLVFASVVVICCFVGIIKTCIKCIKDRYGQPRQVTSTQNRMLIHKFKTGDSYETCAICLEDYIEGEDLRVLPCAHAYHSKCINPWLRSGSTTGNRVCPVCKRRVLATIADLRDCDSDRDNDRTPLVNPSNQNQTIDGGTFADESEQSLSTTADRLRNLREVAGSFLVPIHPTIITIDNHSSTEVYTSASDMSDFISIAESDDQSQSFTDDEVYVDTSPNVESDERINDVFLQSV